MLGHTDRERRRLALQASIINPLTENFLRRAGVSAGMHVLELGCGIGEVSLIAARLIGPHGHLHCIDIDAAARSGTSQAQSNCSTQASIAARHHGHLTGKIE